MKSIPTITRLTIAIAFIFIALSSVKAQSFKPKFETCYIVELQIRRELPQTVSQPVIFWKVMIETDSILDALTTQSVLETLLRDGEAYLLGLSSWYESYYAMDVRMRTVHKAEYKPLKTAEKQRLENLVDSLITNQFQYDTSPTKDIALPFR